MKEVIMRLSHKKAIVLITYIFRRKIYSGLLETSNEKAKFELTVNNNDVAVTTVGQSVMNNNNILFSILTFT
ncbi:MAG: hypothetical protein ACYDG2_22570 [Ruminiclostridium sp.]